MTSCSNQYTNRPDYQWNTENEYALLYDVNNWNKNKALHGDSNFSANGATSGFPPPNALGQSNLFGETQCQNPFGNEFNCNVGVLGLFPHKDVNTFRTNYDQATVGQSLSAMDPKTGEIFADSVNDNICKKAYGQDLTIDFGKYDKLIDAPITVMHKNWGSVRKKVTINGGVHVNNVALSDKPISGIYNGKTFNQKCLALTLRGSNYTCNNDNDTSCTYGLTNKKVGGNTEYISTSNGYIPDVGTPCPGSEGGENKDCQLEPGQKVGACVATEYMLGPGYYEVLAHAPDITQFNKDPHLSNGYCWAIWTFHYEEHYGCDSDKTDCDKFVDTNQFIDPSANSKADVSGGYCYNEALVLKSGTNQECYTEPTTDKNDMNFTTSSSGVDQNLYLPGKNKSIGYKSALTLFDDYSLDPGGCYGTIADYGYKDDKCMVDTSTGVVNHEIDIEIPGSWPGKKSTDANSKYWTPSTWNCNTFLGSNNPALVRGTWSSQYVIQKLDPETKKAIKNGEANSFLAKPPEDLGNPENQQNLEFHKYAFNWCVPGDKDKGPYVEWFFDDKPVFRSYTMVPTRSSRLVVGGWFPHWTQNGNSDCTPSAKAEILSAPFNTAKIFVASIIYKPNCYDPVKNQKSDALDNTTVDFPQNYDQCGKGGITPIALGFTPPNLPGTKLPNGIRAKDDIRVCNENCPTTKPSPSSKSPLMTIVIVLIVLVVLAFLGLGIYMFVNRKQSSSKQ